MRKFFVFISFSFLLLSSCQPDNSTNVLEGSSVFTINPRVENIIKTPKGVEITIPANAILADEKEISLNVKSFHTRFEMIQAGLSTLTTEDEILISDGMISITSPNHVDVAKNFFVKFPTPSYTSNMKLFFGRNKGGEIGWTLSKNLNPTENGKNIAEGKKLFDANCSACHRLSFDMTGPALGNITQYRDSAYLVNFTKSSSQLIASGDATANCISDIWAGVIMNSFPNLSTKEIMYIYQWIESESNNTSCTNDRLNFPVSCSQRNGFTFTYDSLGNLIDSTLNPPRSVGFSSSTDSDKLRKKIENSGEYELELSDFGWYNIDLFMSRTSDFIDNFSFQMEGEHQDSIQAVVIINSQNAIIPLHYYNGLFYMRYGQGKEQINFPKDLPLRVIAIGSSMDNKVQFGHIDIKSQSTGNDHKLKLETRDWTYAIELINE